MSIDGLMPPDLAKEPVLIGDSLLIWSFCAAQVVEQTHGRLVAPGEGIQHFVCPAIRIDPGERQKNPEVAEFRFECDAIDESQECDLLGA
jgi:hypothetical protein